MSILLIVASEITLPVSLTDFHEGNQQICAACFRNFPEAVFHH